MAHPSGLGQPQGPLSKRCMQDSGHREFVEFVAFDPRRPNSARVHNYLLGGKDHYAADREWVQQLLAVNPEFRDTAVANRRFMEWAVRYLTGKGITQFLDLGAGLPASPNVHEVAQTVHPDARVVYADHDPVVVRHGQACMTTEGSTAMIESDLRDPVTLLNHQGLRRLLNLREPIAVMLISMLHEIADEDDPAGLVARLMAQVPSGSYLILSHLTGDIKPGRCTRPTDLMMYPRSRAEIQGLFSGLDLVSPGLVTVPLWRPDIIETLPSQSHLGTYAGVARKP